MQDYNYADEIIKDRDNNFSQRRYVRYYAKSVEDIFNRSVQNSLFAVNVDDTNKEIAFKEGLRNDSIKL